ncbi:Hpt domain-containing protein [Roseibium sp.]|uniref:Hpt domain-containing protein n=1 Tax=Roseibium sp. TaxID=1936156 RepID=UPI003A9864F2
MSHLLEDRQKAMFSAYSKRLQGELVTLQLHLGQLGAGGDDDGLREAIRHIAHRLAGSARLFGFNSLTEPAQTVEILVGSQADYLIFKNSVELLANSVERAVAQGPADTSALFQEASTSR